MDSSKKRPSPIEVVDLTSDSDVAHKCLKPSYLESSSDDDDQDSEIVALSNNTPIIPISESKVSTTTDEVQVVGIRNEQCLPHMRQHCLQHRHDPNRNADNRRYCDKCYCYVCDILASECQEWSSHCNATDKGVCQAFWKLLRSMNKKTSSDTNLAGRVPRPQPVRLVERDARTEEKASLNRVTQDLSQLTKCRHCRWVGRLEGKVRKYATRADWCARCGRVASLDFYAKEQAPQYTPRSNDILLGTKSIPFRLKVRDPRQMKLFRKEWEERRWEYDVKEWEEDLFNHRFGQRPTLKMIFYSIPILEENKLPTDWDPGYRWDPKYERYPHSARREYPGCASETEALLIQDRNHRLILLLLHIMQQDLDRTSAALNVNIEAKWSKETSNGVSVMRFSSFWNNCPK